jgi:hypothetical protein
MQSGGLRIAGRKIWAKVIALLDGVWLWGLGKTGDIRVSRLSPRAEALIAAFWWRSDPLKESNDLRPGLVST